MRYCCVPLCPNKTTINKNIKFYRIPKDKKLRKCYDIAIRNKHLKVDSPHTRICSQHFEGGKRLNNTVIPTIFLWTKENKPRKLPTVRQLSLKTDTAKTIQVSLSDFVKSTDIGVQTERQQCEHGNEISQLKKELSECHMNLMKTQSEFDHNRYVSLKSKFCIEQFRDCDSEICFYTGFPDFDRFAICFEYLKPSIKCLPTCTSLARQKLTPINQFFLVMCRLRLGLLENDLAERFGISQSSVSKIFSGWINMMYFELKEIDIMAFSRTHQ